MEKILVCLELHDTLLWGGWTDLLLRQPRNPERGDLKIDLLQLKELREKIESAIGVKFREGILRVQKCGSGELRFHEVCLPKKILGELVSIGLKNREETGEALVCMIDDSEGPDSSDCRKKGHLNPLRRAVGIPEV